MISVTILANWSTGTHRNSKRQCLHKYLDLLWQQYRPGWRRRERKETDVSGEENEDNHRWRHLVITGGDI